MPTLFFDKVNSGSTLTNEETDEDILTFDANIETTHRASKEVPSHPVEGETVTDNFSADKRILEMRVALSNMDNQGLDKEGGQRLVEAHDDLVRLAEGDTLVRVMTDLEDYGRMALVDYNATRDPDRSEMIEATLEFQEIEFADLELVEIPREETVQKEKKQQSTDQSFTPPDNAPEAQPFTFPQRSSALSTTEDEQEGRILSDAGLAAL